MRPNNQRVYHFPLPEERQGGLHNIKAHCTHEELLERIPRALIYLANNDLDPDEILSFFFPKNPDIIAEIREAHPEFWL